MSTLTYIMLFANDRSKHGDRSCQHEELFRGKLHRIRQDAPSQEKSELPLRLDSVFLARKQILSCVLEFRCTLQRRTFTNTCKKSALTEHMMLHNPNDIVTVPLKNRRMSAFHKRR